MAVQTRSTTTVVEKPTKEASLKANPAEPEFPDIKTIRDTIPAHCFEPSLVTSYYYVVRDLTIVAGLAWAALTYIPTLPDPYARAAAWAVYGYVQGLFCTGVWILGHECGHGAFSKNTTVNNITGWFLHSILMVPYFSWKFSHARHHKYTGHMKKDMAFVPVVMPDAVAEKQQAKMERQKQAQDITSRWAAFDLGELLEDTPIAQMVSLISHQLFGWQSYLFFNASAGKGSLQRENKGMASWLRVSHFDPFSAVFRRSEAFYIFLSDVGLGLVLTGLYFASQAVGVSTVLLLYLVPYLWVHHWLVAITYLHHNHPDVYHYDENSWTFVKGALATIDRDFGFIGKHIFHGIIEKHVVHHLFSRIPFYKADEATEAIKPLLGDLYRCDNRSFLGQLWAIYGTCKYVESDPTCPGRMRWVK